MSEIVREGNSFVVKEQGRTAAEITWIPVGEHLWQIDHTFVSPELRGGKLAENLVKRVVEHARENGMKIFPLCSYAEAQFRRHKEYGDVWQRDENG